jgi:hypothetical protein
MGKADDVTGDNIHVEELLSDFVSGHLEKSEAERVAAHLKVCPDCRSARETMAALKEYMVSEKSTIGSDHISDQQLWLYYSNVDTLDAAVRAKIELHVGRCLDCSAALSLLYGLEQDLTPAHSDLRLAGPAKKGFIDALTQWLRKPVLAYALLALTLYPAIRWIISKGNDRPLSVLEEVPDRSVRLSPQLRQVTDIVSVSRKAGHAFVALEIPFYALADSKTYTVAVTDTVGGVIANARGSVTLGSPGVINVLLDTGPLVDGVYELTLVERSQANISDTSVTTYPFRLATR